MKIRVYHNDDYFLVELRWHRDVPGWEFLSMDPQPREPVVRRVVFEKAVDLAMRAVREATR